MHRIHTPKIPRLTLCTLLIRGNHQPVRAGRTPPRAKIGLLQRPPLSGLPTHHFTYTLLPAHYDLPTTRTTTFKLPTVHPSIRNNPPTLIPPELTLAHPELTQELFNITNPAPLVSIPITGSTLVFNSPTPQRPTTTLDQNQCKIRQIRIHLPSMRQTNSHRIQNFIPISIPSFRTRTLQHRPTHSYAPHPSTPTTPTSRIRPNSRPTRPWLPTRRAVGKLPRRSR